MKEDKFKVLDEVKAIKVGNEMAVTLSIGIGIKSDKYNGIIQHESGQDHIYEVIPLPLVSKDGNLYTFKGTSQIFNAGSFKQAFRMYPKNNLLPHRQDFCYVRWF